MLSEIPGKKLNLYVPDYVIFDLETTGRSSTSDAVVEISAVKVTNHQVADEFTALVNPERPIPYQASSVNGITDDMVRNCPVFKTALKDFLDFAGDSILAGHNIHTFDIKFLNRDAAKYWGLSVGNNYVDTLTMAREILPEMTHHRLTDLAGYYGIAADGAHRALNDCRMNQQVYECLGKQMQKERANAPSCPWCGKPMKKRSGRKGPFWGCSAYPYCFGTRNITETNN